MNAASPLVDVASNDFNKNVKKCILSAPTPRVNDSWSLQESEGEHFFSVRAVK